VSTDNNVVTVQYDQNTAQNTAADIGNTAQNMGNAIANEADQTAAKVNNSAIVADHDNGNQSDSNTTDNRQ
jgi:hypothetical protein